MTSPESCWRQQFFWWRHNFKMADMGKWINFCWFWRLIVAHLLNIFPNKGNIQCRKFFCEFKFSNRIEKSALDQEIWPFIDKTLFLQFRHQVMTSSGNHGNNINFLCDHFVSITEVYLLTKFHLISSRGSRVMAAGKKSPPPGLHQPQKARV